MLWHAGKHRSAGNGRSAVGLACGPDDRTRVVGPGPPRLEMASIEALHCRRAATGDGGEVSVPHAAWLVARRLPGRPQVAIRLSSCTVGETSSDLGVHGLVAHFPVVHGCCRRRLLWAIRSTRSRRPSLGRGALRHTRSTAVLTWPESARAALIAHFQQHPALNGRPLFRKIFWPVDNVDCVAARSHLSAMAL